ncbi:hypothetical protein CYY_005614 [Polysphondylium violaceum]|uniref:PCI domain-containing protein n=1 Tax=Polysphondylium violaceum TaxID=133409 RepID=A0A8J4PSQ3_9MYCE|nr:hypothetical protein CYY_005614 [Polysphondylium violaceum]
MKPYEYLESLKQTIPDLAPHIIAIRETYDNKLWHQLTQQLEQIVVQPQMMDKKELPNIYQYFIKDFETKLKPLSLVEICIPIARQYDNVEARKFIETISQKVKKDKSAYIFSLSFIATMFLHCQDLVECKKTIELAKDELQGITGLEPTVYSCFYLVCTDYYRAKNQAGEFYKNALMYLSYCKLENISQEIQSSLAFDLCIAALIGDSIYSFGDLIVNPILKSLDGSKNAWLISLLKAFNLGDIAQYEALIQQHRDIVSTIPALTNNKQRLGQKISILALLELAFRTPSDQRSISFQKISNTTKLPLTEIEHLLMKALSLELIKGTINQVDQIIHVTWVTPRILDFNQIASMNQRITEWASKTKTSLQLIENDTIDLVA